MKTLYDSRSLNDGFIKMQLELNAFAPWPKWVIHFVEFTEPEIFSMKRDDYENNIYPYIAQWLERDKS